MSFESGIHSNMMGGKVSKHSNFFPWRRGLTHSVVVAAPLAVMTQKHAEYRPASHSSSGIPYVQTLPATRPVVKMGIGHGYGYKRGRAIDGKWI